jgi:hypothetical protein
MGVFGLGSRLAREAEWVWRVRPSGNLRKNQKVGSFKFTGLTRALGL